MTLHSELPALLPTWLPEQRWFSAKGREIVGTVPVTATPLITDGELLLDHVIAAVSFADGSPVQHYQLFVGRRTVPRHELEHMVIGAVDDRIAFDGLWDTDVTAWLLAAVRAGTTVGALRLFAEPDADLAAADVPGRVLGVEQSNTSVSWGEQSILKVFRRVQAGVNPDLELHRALRSVGSGEVAAVQGAIEGELDGQPTTLGMLQDFAANSADGWSMALASVRDLLAEADLRADEVGGDFAAEARRLGETIGVLHGELAQALGTGTGDAAALALGWEARLTVAAAEVPALAPHVEAVRAVYAQVTAQPGALGTQRVHGDLHLGQTLRTPYGWLVLDFEGEPAAPLAERVRPDSPLRDVAGMLRSFDYAAFHQLSLVEPGEWTDPHSDSQLLWRATEWADRNRTAFCEGYAFRVGSDPREHGALLRAFELDKAVYEVLYETRSRPAWAAIPLASIRRILADSPTG